MKYILSLLFIAMILVSTYGKSERNHGRFLQDDGEDGVTGDEPEMTFDELYNEVQNCLDQSMNTITQVGICAYTNALSGLASSQAAIDLMAHRHQVQCNNDASGSDEFAGLLLDIDAFLDTQELSLFQMYTGTTASVQTIFGIPNAYIGTSYNSEDSCQIASVSLRADVAEPSECQSDSLENLEIQSLALRQALAQTIIDALEPAKQTLAQSMDDAKAILDSCAYIDDLTNWSHTHQVSAQTYHRILFMNYTFGLLKNHQIAIIKMHSAQFAEVEIMDLNQAIQDMQDLIDALEAAQEQAVEEPAPSEDLLEEDNSDLPDFNP